MVTEMTISIENEVNYKFDFDENQVIKTVIETALEYVSCPYETVVSVTLTDNESIQSINNEFRGIDNATDVLSFPMLEYAVPGDFEFLEGDEAFEAFDPESGELVLGDIIISTDKVKSQADEFGHSEKRELAFLVAHSMFHLFGYDHMTDEEAKEMEAKQEEVLKMLNINR